MQSLQFFIQATNTNISSHGFCIVLVSSIGAMYLAVLDFSVDDNDVARQCRMESVFCLLVLK